jgi:hypothetical protein
MDGFTGKSSPSCEKDGLCGSTPTFSVGFRLLIYHQNIEAASQISVSSVVYHGLMQDPNTVFY